MSAPDRPRILLLIPHLGGGGAEHIVETLARHLDARKYDLHLVIATRTVHRVSAQFPSSITIHRLRANRIRTSAWSVLRLIWRLKPVIIFGGTAHMSLLLLLLRPFIPAGTRVIVRQSGSASALFAGTCMRIPSRLLFRLAYSAASGIICQTDSMAAELLQTLKLKDANLSVLPNPVDLENIRQCAQKSNVLWHGPGPNLLTVGRLSFEKGFDLLIEAFARVHTRFPNAELVIGGVGPCESALKQQVFALGLANKVTFAGYLPLPPVRFPGTTAFVLSSRDDAMPNAVLEAAAAGLPIVAAPSSQGITDLLRHQPGVWVAADTSARALEDSLLQALSALRPAERFPHSWVERFALKTSIQAYEKLLDRTLLSSGR